MPQGQEIKRKEDFNFPGNGKSRVGIQTRLHRFPLIGIICTCLKYQGSHQFRFSLWPRKNGLRKSEDSRCDSDHAMVTCTLWRRGRGEKRTMELMDIKRLSNFRALGN